jgi:hypothetical protein
VIQADFVDGLDGGFRVRVGGQENALRIRENVESLSEKRDPRHSGHSLIYDEESQRLVSEGKVLEDLEARRSRLGPEDPVVPSVAFSEVPEYGAQYR